GNEAPGPLPDRRDRRRVGVRRPVPGAHATGRPAARPRAARGLRRPGLDRPGRGALAAAADQLPALAGRLPAGPTVDRRRLLRGDGGRSAGAPAVDGRTGRRADRGDPRQPDGPEHPGERGAGRLGRPQAPDGQQDPPGRRHAGAPPRPPRHPGRRPGPGAGRGAGGGGAGGHGRARRAGLGRPGVHRRRTGGRCRRARHPARGRQAARGETRLRAAAAAVGRRALLRLGRPLPAAGQGRRTLARDGRRASFRGLRRSDAPPLGHLRCRKSI
ncbi:MAG: Mobile element protein, partial [uncultured Thermomicrobiales bacterium]